MQLLCNNVAMKKKYRHTFSIKAETAARLACLSTDMDISMSSVIDRLVEWQWNKTVNNDDLPQTIQIQTETPPGS
jgi:hypothetical protein